MDDSDFEVLKDLQEQEKLKEEQEWKKSISRRIGFIRSCLELEEKLVLNFTIAKQDGSYAFSGFKIDGGDEIHLCVDHYQVELIAECNTIQEIYDCYKEMEFYPKVNLN